MKANIKEAIESIKEDGASQWNPSRLDVLAEILGLGAYGDSAKLLYDCLQYAAIPHEDRHKQGSDWKHGIYRSAGHTLAAFVLEREDLIEYGTGIGAAWITDAGEEVLSFIRQYRGENE